jgi:hypothetical protein
MKCKACNTTFIPKYFNQKFCVDNDECLKAFSDYAKITKEKTERKEWSERKSKMKKEMLTVQDYLKIAQQVFNAYIRKRDQGKNCISCQKPIRGVVNASHYYNSNNHWNVRFNELNVHSSCYRCNCELSGNLIEYGINLEKLIGPDEFIILREEAYKTRKFTRDELKEIIEKYKKLK